MKPRRKGLAWRHETEYQRIACHGDMILKMNGKACSLIEMKGLHKGGVPGDEDHNDFCPAAVNRVIVCL